jgi:hypothetical protein
VWDGHSCPSPLTLTSTSILNLTGKGTASAVPKAKRVPVQASLGRGLLTFTRWERFTQNFTAPKTFPQPPCDI